MKEGAVASDPDLPGPGGPSSPAVETLSFFSQPEGKMLEQEDDEVGRRGRVVETTSKTQGCHQGGPGSMWAAPLGRRPSRMLARSFVMV